MMPSQRVRDAGIRTGNKSSNGPLRVWGTAEPSIRDVRAYVSCREPVGAPQRGSIAANQGGTADRVFVLDRPKGFVRGVFLLSGGLEYAADQTMACLLKTTTTLYILTTHLSGG